MKAASFLTAVSCCAILGGCASGPATHYAWGEYTENVGEHATGQLDDAKMLAVLLEAGDESARYGLPLAPGLYAEMGTLYFRAGKGREAIECYRKEAESWPESRQFMQALISGVERVLLNKGAAK